MSGLLYLFYHNKSVYTSAFFSLDTMVTVRSGDNCTDEIKKIVTDLSDIFDCYSSDSEISRLNSAGKLECSCELTEFLEETEKLNSEYGYGTDITSGNLIRLWHNSLAEGRIPEKSEIQPFLSCAGRKNYTLSGNTVQLLNNCTIDTGAAAKGYVMDKVYEYCLETKPSDTIVSTGSTTLLYSSDSSRVFSCAVKKDRDSIAGTAEVTPCFVSTSGDYERFTEINGKRWHHILDMNTGYPADSGLSSVTVFCDSGIASDFLSTLIFTEGKDNLDKYLSSDRFSIIAVDNQGNIFKSESLVFHENR